MRCLICGKTALQTRTIKTLFKEEPIFRCDSCSRRYQLNFGLQAIPKEDGLVMVYSLFTENNNLPLEAYNEEIKNWFLMVLKEKQEKDLILYLEQLDESLLNNLDLIKGNIYILTKTQLLI